MHSARPRFGRRCVVSLFFSLLAGCASSTVTPVPARQTAEHAALSVTYEYDYLRYLPKGYDADPRQRWPLLLFLHGLGERGRNLPLIKRQGLPKLIAADDCGRVHQDHEETAAA